MAANGTIGVKGWRNYSTFALFAGGSQRADRQTSILVDTFSGNLAVLATDWLLAARIPCALARAYNYQDSTSGVDRPFGPGWSWQYDMNIVGALDGTGTVTVKFADGAEYDFTSPTGTTTKTYTSPAGMHDYLLTWIDGSPDTFTLTVGRMTYNFTVHAGDSRARLMSILDANGNGIVIDRTMSGSDPTNVINYLQVRYYSGGWTTQNIVQPTYSGALITKLRLLATQVSSDYLDLHYTYTNVNSADRLTKVEPKFGSAALNMEVKYDYNTSAGLEMNKLYDSLGAQAGTQYYWTVNYSASKVASIVFPINSTPTTGTAAYNYSPSAPASWSHGSPSSWTTVTDAESKVWYYGHNSDGTVQFALDPLWVNSTHESYTEYAYNGDLQVTSVKTARPNAESGQLTTSYYYNSNKKLAAVADVYGFVSWYVYGSRTPYSGGGTGATTNDVVGVFTLMPNQKAYDDSDHTDSETAPPGGMSSPLNVGSFVSWDNGAGYWKYTDGNSNTVKLSRSVMDYEYTTGTGKLEKLRSCSAANYGDGGNPPGYSLTTASGATEQRFNATTGDLERSYTPKQFQDGTIGYTAYTHDQTYGAVTEVEGADSVDASAGKKTKYYYNSTKTRVTKVEQPQDNTDQWTETIYDDRLFALQVKRPDIQSWGIDPIVSVTEYDNNGNVTEQWQADPTATPSEWDGDTTGSGYYQLSLLAYDRINRLTQSTQYVDWDQDSNVESLVSQFFYDKNGNRIRSRGPAYDVGGTDYYDYSFVEYDGDNRVDKAYNALASTNASLSSVPGGTKYTQYVYDLLGNASQVREPLYVAGPPARYVSVNTYDWMSRLIQTSQTFTLGGGFSVRSTRQHFSASGGVFWSEDGEGYKMYPEADLDGRLFKMHRGASNGDNDERTYDADGRVLHYYNFQDVDDGKIYRTRNEYDNMGQLITLKAPEVPNPAGGGNIIYEQNTTYDVLGRPTSREDFNTNVTNFTFDVLGRTINVEDAESYDTQTFFDARGLHWKTITPRGAEYISTYDARGLRTQLDVDHDSTTDTSTYQYDDNGRLTETVLPDGGERLIGYDELGRKVLSQSLLSGSDYLDTEYLYDNDNRLTKLTMPGGYEYNYDYDDLGNMLQGTDSASDDTDFTYDLNNRRITTTQANGLIVTNVYDWKTGGISSVTQEISASSGDDIVMQYALDDNGRPTTTTDGRGLNWVKTYDAMGRMTSLTTPNQGGSTYSQTLTLDGNGNITKTVDFKSVTHYYKYDGLNRMEGHGASGSANDETYTWNCCNEVSGYTDNFGTATLLYDDLGRLESHTDSQGNQVQYEYDALSRVTKLTPPQGSNYRTQYTYNKNGSLATAEVYDAGSGATTACTYNTTSGKLTQRDFPTVSSQNIRTLYGYDGAGRLSNEIIQRVGGGTTFLYNTAYAYSNLTYGKQVTRTEGTYSGGFPPTLNVDNRLTYKYNAVGWQNYEEREDWVSAAWTSRYDITQEYAKNGNRTRYHKNVAGGFTGTYGRAEDLSYAFDNLNRPTAITDADDSYYNAAVTCDLNGNITQIEETSGSPATSTVLSTFTLDALNRVTSNGVRYYDPSGPSGAGTYNKAREHTYSGTGAILKSNYKFWKQGGMVPIGDNVEHTWDQAGRHVQNYDGTSTYGYPWRWVEVANCMGSPLKSPNADTSTQNAYNSGVAGGQGNPQRRSFLTPTTDGDTRELWGQGRPEAKDSVAAWANGQTSIAASPTSDPNIESRIEFTGTVASADMSRATDVRERDRVGFFGSGYSAIGSTPRMTSETIGRDINPIGRGDGIAYVGGWLALGQIAPMLPNTSILPPGEGSSVNNSSAGGPCVSCLNSCKSCCWNQGLWGRRCKTPVTTGCAAGLRAAPLVLCEENCHELNSIPSEYAPWCDRLLESCYFLCRYGDPSGCPINYQECISIKSRHWCYDKYDQLWDWTDCIGACEFNPDVWKQGNPPDGQKINVKCSVSYKYCGVDATTQIKSALRIACRYMVSCRSLPRDVRECVEKVCRGDLEYTILCKGATGRDVAAYTDIHLPNNKVNPCQNNSKILRTTYIRTDKLNLNCDQVKDAPIHELAHLLSHELMHVCDCRNQQHNQSNSDCIPTGGGGGTHDSTEGWAEICTQACWGRSGRIEPYNLVPNIDCKSLCTKCYK